MTRSETTNRDITALLKSRHTLLWIVTREETRVERAVMEAAGTAVYETCFWDCVFGLQDAKGDVLDANAADPMAVLALIRETKERRVYILRDLHKLLDSPMVLRAVRSLARHLQGAPRNEARTVVILTPSGDVPVELSGHATVIDYPLPERAEIAGVLDAVIAALPEDMAETVAKNGNREKCIDAALGLTAEEAANCYAKSLVVCRDVVPAAVTSEKKRVIARERVLTWTDPDPRGLDAVGGLELGKEWIRRRRSALSQSARQFGLPAPKGVLLVGVTGCGKSLMAKAIATAWGVPLLRMDAGAMKSKYVGESEANIRKAFATAETVAPCVQPR